MRSTFRLSFALKNTYRVNGILYSLKQIPLLRRLLPQALYRSRGLKRFAGLLAAVWELLTAFLGKLLYMLTMVTGVGVLYENAARGTVFLHILLCLTVIGGFMNTGLFNPTRDKYYAMILMRMDARSYTLVNYAYTLVKVIVGFLPFTLFFGLANGVPLWLCLVLPFSIAGCKLTAAALTLRSYEKRGRAYNENAFNKRSWLLAALLLAAAYGLPAVGASLPPAVSAAVLLAFVLSGALSVRKLLTFGAYREINQELLGQLFQQMDTAAQATKKNAEKAISADCSITSHRRGFAYLNELFVKRHRRILWSAVKKIAFVCAFLIAGAALLLQELGYDVTGVTLRLRPGAEGDIDDARRAAQALGVPHEVLDCRPYFVFVMYAVNRGTGFTQALFMNCDHSLLTYSFYKKPRFILKLFRIRLLEIMKINALPALVIGPGLSLLLYLSGGTDDPLSYIVLPVAVLCISMFFSVHYLTIYYLLQPYNAGTELKSGAYTLVMSATYLICFSLMQLRVPVLLFGLMTIVFCVLYCALACVLIYKLAPKTFRIRT